MTTDTAEPVDGRLLIDGQLRTSGDVLVVDDLAEGGTFARVAAASETDAEEALAAAAEASHALRETTVVERVGWLDAIADGIETRKDDLAETIVREAGKPISSARGEVAAAAERFRRAIEELRTDHGEYRRGTTAGHDGWQAIVKPEPLGTVLCISPYNYPLSTTAQQVAPALAAGNAVICKPSSKTPVSGAILADIVSEVEGLPAGAFNFVSGPSSVVGDRLAGDDRIDAVAMTGSSDAGKHVARESGIVALQMELGGNAPAIVFPDADLDDVAGQCVKGSFKYAGQRCSAVSRVLAHESVHDEVVDRIADQVAAWQPGDLFDPETRTGPLISESQAEWVQELVDDAVSKGARLVAGGDHDGRLFEPTLLADVPHDARLLTEEQFGPVAVVTSVADEAEAVSLANASSLGLDAAVFTADHDRAMRVADELRVGGVHINGAPSHGLGDIPYGGVNDSGIGRNGLGPAIDAFTTTKSIVL